MKLILSSSSSLYSVSLNRNNEAPEFSFQPQLLNPPRPNDPSILGHLGPTLVGSCRGLLCLSFPKCCILWNPATKTHHKMPEPQEAVHSHHYVVHGLGYDEINDDYKVVRVYQNLGFDSKVLVFSLKSNSWTRVADFPYFVHFGVMCDVFVNGALHFKVSTKKDCVEVHKIVDSDYWVAAFDVSNYECKLVSQLTWGGVKPQVELGVLDERLCMIRNYAVGVSQCFLMKEYGVNSSWTELFRVKRDDAIGLRLRPISYLGDEKKRVIFEGAGEIFCFDVGSNSLKDLEIDGIEEDFEVCVCMESEVVLGCVDGNDKMEEVNENTLESEVVIGSVDGNDGYETQQGNEENLQVSSAERDLGATGN